MTRLAIVADNNAAPQPSAARQALQDQLARIAAARIRQYDLRQTLDRMREAKDGEARTRSVLETQIRCEEEAMKQWALNPQGAMPVADTVAREFNEGALANAKRVADTIRAAEPEQMARHDAAARHVAELEAMLPELANAIMLEEARIFRAELDDAIDRANALSAKLFGLRSYLHDSGAHKTGEQAPVSYEMWPEQRAIQSALREWQAHASRLATDPKATMEN